MIVKENPNTIVLKICRCKMQKFLCSSNSFNMIHSLKYYCLGLRTRTLEILPFLIYCGIFESSKKLTIAILNHSHMAGI